MTEHKTVGGHFQIISELNSGGFGQTYLAEDLRQMYKPKCVVKQLKPQSNDPKIIELAARLFEQEVIALYQLGKHPQIPTLINHFEENGEFYFVQEYIEGNTFDQELRHGKVYNQAKVIEIISQLLDVLSFVHQQNVIHRDIKPANLINRKSDGKIVLIDFGAVKQVTNQTAVYPNQMPQNTIAIGSDGFMPSEQLAGQPKYSSDVYAVGMFAVQLLTQTHPTQLRQNQRTGEWIWQDKTNVNPRFAEIVSQMIRYDFRQRFQNAIEANNALKRLNLNGQNQPFEVKRQNEPADYWQTNATYSLPIPDNQQNQEITRQRKLQYTNLEPQYNYQQQFQQQIPQQPIQRQISPAPIQSQQKTTVQNQPPISLLEQYAGNNPNNYQPTLPISDESITISSFSFSDLKDSQPFRYFVYIVIGVLAFVLLVQLTWKPYVNTTQNQLNQLPPGVSMLDDSYKNAALKSENKAVTSDDWRRVSQEWQLAIDFYAVAQMTAQSKSDKDDAKAQEAFCLDRKLSALKKSDKLRNK